ncbi:DNA cytosine methyltransferase [Pseudomonas laurylsulfatiphila]
MRFIDVFAGCGGLSLGLLKAGCEGVIAIEKNPMAFETLRHNLIDGQRFQFNWPTWLPKEAMSCEDFLSNYKTQIPKLKGEIDLMVGGPPCQGFSTAGKRNPADPRNKMAEQYLNIVKIVRPTYIVIENVSGFNSKFNESKKTSDNETEVTFKESYADFICGELKKIGYNVSRGKINCADFGVPQNRYRYLIVCSLEGSNNLLEDLLNSRSSFLTGKKLNPQRAITVHDAIGDLETTGKRLVENLDSDRKGFFEAAYEEPEIKTAYLTLMRDNYASPPNSRRLAKHKANTMLQFKRIQLASEPGKSLSKAARERLEIKKHALTVLSKNHAAPTITTLAA